MSLIVCPDCGKEISDKSSYCINCGCPIDNTYEENEKLAESSISIVALCIMVFNIIISWKQYSFISFVLTFVVIVLSILAIRDDNHKSTCATIAMFIAIALIIFEGVFYLFFPTI